MIPIEIMLMFLGASALLALAPGPDNIFVLTQSALRGPSAGLIVTMGLCTGLVCHTMAVAFGVATVFRNSAVAFTVLKLIGAAYLLFLAWKAFREAAADLTAGTAAAIPLRRLYARGIIMNITNPKVSLFFLAFLPQFADPNRGALMGQMVFLGALFIVATIVVFSAICFLAGAIGERLRRSPRVPVILSRITGVVFVLLALKLATSGR
ncbi:LysE family translocator [bacterium]|nr:LysE family translocator [candidate division CSSED10-310 bacterium]